MLNIARGMLNIARGMLNIAISRWKVSLYMVLLLILVDVIKNASDDIGDGRVRVFSFNFVLDII